MICFIINETCNAIWDCLSEQYVRPPRASDDWKRIAKDFESTWNLPHCIDAIDGKHISIKSPLNSGSLYHNYKGIFSIILMAIAMLATYSLGLITIAECFVTRLWEKRFLMMK